MFRIILLVGLLLCAGSTVAGSISGRVVNQVAQTPIAGARIELVNQGPGLGSDPYVLASGISDADGRYYIETSALTYYVTAVASADGYAPRTQAGQPCQSSLSCYFGFDHVRLEGDVVANFTLGAGSSISGRVRDADSGQTPARAWIWLRNETLRLYASAEADASGNFSVPNLHAGDYTLTATALRADAENTPYLHYQWPDRHCDEVQVLCSDIPPEPIVLGTGTAVEALQVDLRQGAYLNVRVLSSATGQPAGYSALLHGPAGPAPLPHPGGIDGIRIGPLLPGVLRLELRPFNAAAFPHFVYPNLPCVGDACDVSAAPGIAIPSTGEVSAETVQVAPLRSVRGRVTDRMSGQPLANVPVWIGFVHEGNYPSWGFISAARALTDASGNYVLEGFSGDDLLVRTAASSLGWIDRIWQDEACGAFNLFCHRPGNGYQRLSFADEPHPQSIDFGLRRSTFISGRVLHPDGSPAANYAVAVVPEQHHLSAHPVIADAQGQFRIDGLEAGGYYLFATAFVPWGWADGTLFPAVGCRLTAPLVPLDCDFASASPVLPHPTFGMSGLTIIVAPQDALFASSFD